MTHEAPSLAENVTDTVDVPKAIREPSIGGQLSFPIRSYSRSDTGAMLRHASHERHNVPVFTYGQAQLFEGDCLEWLAVREARSIHGVVTDPPYGLVEYTPEQQAKLRRGRGGVWRIPPSFDGHQRSPLPRCTILTDHDLRRLEAFFSEWATVLYPVLVPGAHVVVASNPLLSYLVSNALAQAGFERRGEIVRLVMTMRGGDRPKNAHEEFC